LDYRNNITKETYEFEKYLEEFLNSVPPLPEGYRIVITYEDNMYVLKG